MNKIKIIIVCLLIPFLILTALACLKIKNKNEFQQKAVLAQEIHKALRSLMLDLPQAHENNVLDVPPDGLWYNRIAFIQGRQGVLEYLIKEGHLFRVYNGEALLIADDIGGFCARRQKETPDILEVQIKAQKNISLISNLKIRMLK